MLKNNILLAFRLLARQRIYSAINLIGLSLGMASFLIIVLFYQYQNSYDQFHTKKDRIYRVNRFMKINPDAGYISKISLKAAESLQNKITGVAHVVRVTDIQTELTYGDNTNRELFLWAADDAFFKVFDFEFLQGNPTTALSEINSIVLTESMAKKYFGDEPAFSNIISTVNKDGHKVDNKVTGIIKDVPPNSHLIIDGLFSYPSVKNYYKKKELENSWAMSHTYLLLEESANPLQVEKIVNETLLMHVPKAGFEQARFPIMPLTEIFFNSSKDGGSQRGSKLLTNILLLIGILILLIASLNYVNLAIARSLKRSKEVGIRKVSGANKNQLVFQFMGESVFFSLLALFLALSLVYLFIPYINNFSNFMYRINLNQAFLLDIQFLSIATSVAIITGLLSGLYPAFIISSFQPQKSLKGENPTSAKISTKKVLVVAQYVVSVFLVVSCIAIFKVFDHLKNQDFGFDKENVVALSIDKVNSKAKIHQLKEKILTIEGVKSVAASSKIPLTHRDTNPIFIHDSKTDFKYTHSVIYIDENYFDLLGIKILEKSKDFDIEFNKQNGIFVSSLFMEKYGHQYALGDVVEVFNMADKSIIDFTASIVGVVNDVKNQVLSPRMGPIIFKHNGNELNYMLVKLDNEKQHESIASIEKTFNHLHPYLTSNLTFIDDELNFIFNMITPFSTLVYYATFFAIIIASMGLFAMALFVTQQRTKEVGIRKIFGSSELSVSILLSRQYIKLILISFLISGPLTFYGYKWLFRYFPEKIEMSWWLLTLVGVGLIFIALATVFSQSWKTAKSNPVDTLRYE